MAQPVRHTQGCVYLLPGGGWHTAAVLPGQCSGEFGFMGVGTAAGRGRTIRTETMKRRNNVRLQEQRTSTASSSPAMVVWLVGGCPFAGTRPAGFSCRLVGNSCEAILRVIRQTSEQN
jgi:hypothetical protein